MNQKNGMFKAPLLGPTLLSYAVAACFKPRVLRGATLASAMALSVVAPADAATIKVTNTNSTGVGSLVWACAQAAAEPRSVDTITFDASVSGVIDVSGPGGNCGVKGDLTIKGPGAANLTVKGMQTYVQNYGDSYLEIEGLTLTNVVIEARHDDGTGDVVLIRDSVFEAAYIGAWGVDIQNSVLRGARIHTNIRSCGGGIRFVNSSLADGSMDGSDIEIRDSIITGAKSNGVDVYCGYHSTGRPVIVANSVISGSAGAGIAVTTNHPAIEISNSVISSNAKDGLLLQHENWYDGDEGTLQFNLTVTNSAITRNGGRAIRGATGDFYGNLPTVASVMRIDNSTIAGNGGGVEVTLGEGGALVSSSIKRSTIADNVADHGGGINIVKHSNTTSLNRDSSLSFDSTLIARNKANVAGPDVYTDVSGFTFKAEYSLIQNPAGAPITSTVAGSNITGQDPKLLRLANLGGTTSVRALGVGSPALNKGNPSLANVPATDQRGAGFPRVAGGRIDIGAFEQQSVDVAPVVLRSLPDVTGNGTPELAALVQSIPTGATTVRVRDALTGAAHWQVTLPGTGEAIDLETLGDANGNGKRDIAVLRAAPTTVTIRDGLTGASVSTIPFSKNLSAVALATLGDVNGNGYPEVAVLGMKPRLNVVEVRDSHTGALIKSATFNSLGKPRDLVALREQASNASSAGLLGVLFDNSDTTVSDVLEIRNVATGTLVTRGEVGFGAESMEVAVLPDSNGNGANEFAVLKSSGEVRMFDLPGFAPMGTLQFRAGDAPLHLTTVPDANGSGVTELAVLGRRHLDAALKAEVRDAATGALIKTMDYSAQYRADDLVAVPDINNNGVPELSHAGPNSSGVVRATQRDVATGVLSSRVNLAP